MLADPDLTWPWAPEAKTAKTRHDQVTQNVNTSTNDRGSRNSHNREINPAVRQLNVMLFGVVAEGTVGHF
jgi:hypothetical protein